MTERLESERAELVALADKLEAISDNSYDRGQNATGEIITDAVIALRRLTGPDQKPVAWHPSDDVPNVARGASSQYILAVYRKRSGKVYSFAAEYLNAYPLRYEYGCPKGSSGFCDECSEDGCPTTGWHVVEGADDDGYTYHSLTLDDGDEVKGWREVPQWGGALSPPPAAGWDAAIEACKKVAEKWLESFMGGEVYVARSIVNAIEAIRHNAPPDSGVGLPPIDESLHTPELIAELQKPAMQLDAPDHGGADAGVGKAAKEVGTWLRGALDCKEWHWDADQHEAAEDAYKALQAALSHPVAANASAEARLREALKNTNQLLIDVMHDQEADIIDRASKQFDKNIDALSAHLHASAEARLREALEQIIRYCDESTDPVIALTAKKALSAHHASDCDKQGER